VLDSKRPIREADTRPGSPASMTLGNMRANGARTLAVWYFSLQSDLRHQIYDTH
jgi:hypothetical protein